MVLPKDGNTVRYVQNFEHGVLQKFTVPYINKNFSYVYRTHVLLIGWYAPKQIVLEKYGT